MGWMNQIGNLLNQYTGQSNTNPPASVHDDFDQVAQTAPRQNLGQALSSTFRSDQTPPFGQMVSNLFGQSNNQQKAGLLNQIMGSLGPGMLSGLPGGLSGLLGGGRQITPDTAANVSQSDVQQLAEHAEKHNPSIVDNVSDFYSQHPTLVKGLGAVALATMLSHMNNRG